MALSLSSTNVHHYQCQWRPNAPPINSTVSSTRLSTTRNFPSAIHLLRTSPPLAANFNARPCRCLALSPGRPPPPESEPPNGNESTGSSGPAATISRLQDTVQIFFAVLLWMFLFFWASVWDGRNNGRPRKGSRFRR